MTVASPQQHSIGYRIGEGGLLRRLEMAAGLTRVGTQVATVLLVAWVPMLLLGVWQEATLGRPDALIRSAAVHVRLLVAAPVLLALDASFPWLCDHTLTQLDAQKFVPAASRPRFDHMVTGARRMADSSLVEAVIVVVALGIGLASLYGLVPLRSVHPYRGLSATQIWYSLTDLPLFQFLLWRSVWRWVIWVRILFGLARIHLDVVPTHPDLCAGLRFLRLPSVAYCVALVFAASAVLSAEISSHFAGATLTTFIPLLIAIALAGTLIAYGPLLLFAPQLYRARRVGLLEVGSIATEGGRHFRSGWIQCSRDGTKVDLQPLASIEQTYRETVKRISVFLIDKRDLITLLAVALLPVVPVILANVPYEDWKPLINVLTGLGP